MNMLVDEEVIYKKRGLGMYVREGAVNKIRAKRQGQFLTSISQRWLRKHRS